MDINGTSIFRAWKKIDKKLICLFLEIIPIRFQRQRVEKNKKFITKIKFMEWVVR
jgi:hypothetical protein